MRIEIPEKVQYIIDCLEKAGYEAYAVGGCVRDAILGRIPQDWDITTSAAPKQVKELFSKTIDTGLQHGTVTVMLSGTGFEVTTYRVDGEYLDGRHPEKVTFTASLEEDLKRRDFTINAMAYHPERGLVDLFGGEKDLEEKLIRCVGNPEERFGEDALRMMRAVRFAAQLNFCIDEKTGLAIRKLAPAIQKVSKERIQAELVKLLVSGHPEKLLELYEFGLTAQFLPEFDTMMVTSQNTKYHCYTVGMHTIKVLESIPADKHLRLAALLHDFGKIHTKVEKDGVEHFYGHAKVSMEMAERILKELRFDNDTIRRVCRLVCFHDYRFPVTKKGIRKAANLVGTEYFSDLICLMRADTMGKSTYAIKRVLPQLDEAERLFAEVLQEESCLALKDLAVNGDDLIKAGFPKGKQIGQILQKLLEAVLEEPEKNQKEILLEMAEETINLHE